jgi:hypothetical protein
MQCSTCLSMQHGPNTSWPDEEKSPSLVLRVPIMQKPVPALTGEPMQNLWSKRTVPASVLSKRVAACTATASTLNSLRVDQTLQLPTTINLLYCIEQPGFGLCPYCPLDMLCRTTREVCLRPLCTTPNWHLISVQQLLPVPWHSPWSR